MEVKNIVWKDVDGVDYGTAHSESGRYIGNVRIFLRGGEYEVVAFTDYKFRCEQRVGNVGAAIGIANVRKFAESELTELLEAA